MTVYPLVISQFAIENGAFTVELPVRIAIFQSLFYKVTRGNIHHFRGCTGDVCVCTCFYVYTYIYIYITHTCTFIYIYIYTDIHIYIYIYTYIVRTINTVQFQKKTEISAIDPGPAPCCYCPPTLHRPRSGAPRCPPRPRRPRRCR